MAKQNPWTQMLPQLMANMIMQRMNQNWEAEQSGIRAKAAERLERQKLLAERIPARAVQTTQPEGLARGVTPGPYDTYWKPGPNNASLYINYRSLSPNQQALSTTAL